VSQAGRGGIATAASPWMIGRVLNQQPESLFENSASVCADSILMHETLQHLSFSGDPKSILKQSNLIERVPRAYHGNCLVFTQNPSGIAKKILDSLICPPISCDLQGKTALMGNNARAN
jgi:hypothetical protein